MMKCILSKSGASHIHKTSLLSMLAIYLLLASIIVTGGCGVLNAYFESSAAKQAENYANESLHEIRNNLTAFQNSMKQGGKQIASQANIISFAQGDTEMRIGLRSNVRSLLSFYVNFKEGVRRTYLYTWDHRVISSSPADRESDGSGSYLAFLNIRQLYDLDTPFREPILTSTVYTPTGDGYYAVIIPLYPDVAAPAASQYLGALVVICDTEYLSGLIPASSSYDAVLLENGRVIAASDKNAANGYQGENASQQMISTNAGEWDLVLFSLYDGTAGQNKLMKSFMLIIIALIIAVNALLMYLLYRRLVGPLSSLVKQVNDIGDGSVRIQPYRESVRELGTLTDGMNDMLERIDNLNTKLRESEVRYYQDRVMFLQTQINPHFLYNNLECVRGMTLENQVDIRQMVSDIAHIYRYCNRAQHMATLKEELDCARVYANILRLRYGERFDIRISCASEDALDFLVPRMILQPLMENSVRHGFDAHMRKKGRIDVKAMTENGRVIIHILDDGEGIDEEMLKRVNFIIPGLEEHKHHIGIANVRRRLSLLFEENAMLSFENQVPSGALAIINIPAKTNI